jgi:hypothetical protein
LPTARMQTGSLLTKEPQQMRFTVLDATKTVVACFVA